MFDVITVGSATVDVFVRTEFCDMIKEKGRDFIAYPVGSKILVDELILTTGGGGTNTAVSLARLGHKAAFLGKIGTFENSRRVMLDLQKEHVNTSLIVRKPNSRTGYSVILDSVKHDRTILVFRGSNNDLRLNEVKLSRLKTKWFYFSTMMGESYKTMEKLALYAEKNRINISFNISSYLAKKGINYLKPILKRTNILVLNKEEANILAGKNKIENLLKKLHKSGPKIVAITDGGHGVYVSDQNYFYHAKPHKVKVVETTGAGDAFASSFLSGIIRKNDVEFAIKLGMTNAESVIKYHGAKNKLLTYNEALRQMKKMPIKVMKKKP
ncbi:carbohydrate kinase family protein [Candidatus Woesearchaeota archaeon]|nr:carbohydrate kinase family protein [Candidatus Woesearchaeota archaeon]